MRSSVAIESVPNLKTVPPGTAPGAIPPLTADQMLWIGRAEALLTEVFGAVGSIEFTNIRQNLHISRSWAQDEILKHLYRALASVEMELPSPATGAFIPAGNTFDALKAVQRVFEAGQAWMAVAFFAAIGFAAWIAASATRTDEE